MKVGVVADTHDNLAAAEEAAALFEREGIGTVLHCGDFISPPLLSAFEGFEFHGVLGNNDGELDGLELAIDDLGAGSELHGRYATLGLDGLRVRVLHGDQGIDAVEREAASGDYDVVFYGHFHEAERRAVEGTPLVNPGAHFPAVPDEHRSVVVLDTDTGETEFVSLV